MTISQPIASGDPRPVPDLDPSVDTALAALRPTQAVTQSIGFRAFTNGMRILHNLEAYELIAAGVIEDTAEFRRFSDNPFMFFLKASDRRASALWMLIQGRQPEALQAVMPLPGRAPTDFQQAA